MFCCSHVYVLNQVIFQPHYYGKFYFASCGGFFFVFLMGASPLVGGSLPRVCWSFPSPLFLPQFRPLFLLFPTFLVATVLVGCQARLISFLGCKCGTQFDVSCFECGVLFSKCSMFCHSSGIVKLFRLFFLEELLEVFLTLRLPFLLLFPFL